MKELDLEKAEELMKLMRSYGATEMEVEQGDTKIKIGFGNSGSVVSYQNPQNFAPVYQPPVVPNLQSERPQAETSPQSTPKAVASGFEIKSPFVGTFYSAPSPGEDSFVSVGQSVRKGQTLCIVEAMKLMNEIESDRDGVLKEILVKNEQPVEYDQPLFIIE